MSLPYNENGYGVAIHCDSGCQPDVPHSSCLKDKFSAVEYTAADGSVCVIDYAALVRHHVEELFPTDVLKSQCIDRKPQNSTGYGWITINLQSVYTYCRADGKLCKYNAKNGCDSTIQLFVDGDDVLKSPKEMNKISYDANITFTSARISKKSTIRIEVRDVGSGTLIFDTEGDVESFLKQPLREGEPVCKHANSIETVSFWRDEYQ